MIACAVTDLPEPDSPTSATVLPGRMRNEIRSSAGTIVPRLSNSMERSRTSIRSANPLSSCRKTARHREAALRHPDLISQCCDPLRRGIFRSATRAGAASSARHFLSASCARAGAAPSSERMPVVGRAVESPRARPKGAPAGLCRRHARPGGRLVHAAPRAGDQPSGGQAEHGHRLREPLERHRAERVDLARRRRAPRASCGRSAPGRARPRRTAAPRD